MAYDEERRTSAELWSRLLDPLNLDLPVAGGRRFARFLAVGASGLVVNNLLLVATTELLGIHYLLSAGLATQGSTLWNFGLSERWVFGDRKGETPVLPRLGRYLLMNNTSLLLRGPLLSILVSRFGVHYVLSNLISLFVIAVLRFVLSDRWIWSPTRKGAAPRERSHTYDIHGIVTVESYVRLPELEYFRTEGSVDSPDIRLTHGRPREPRSPSAAIRYDDGLRRCGFEVSISNGTCTEIRVSPLLKWSPHVLYTNVFEPILRWTFVRKGYALIHAACLAFDERAVLITAQTDTGKTTTILRTIDHHAWAFVSDDMTILRKDGQVLSYPKPLTISLHTLQAVKAATLKTRERLTLQVQSRLHSRTGRHFALWLSRSGFPAASLNALVQLLIPPPKYGVDRLTPGVTFADSARLSHVVLIERGPELEESLNNGQALETLLKNTEDAYGFPPYPALESFLSTWEGADLHDRERQIIREALGTCSATRLRSPRYSWWQRLPALIEGTFGWGGKAASRIPARSS